MGADCYWRIDTEAASAEVLTEVANLVAVVPEREVEAWVSPDLRVFYGRASFEDGPTEQLFALSEAVHGLVGGTLRHSDDFEASGPMFELPEGGVELSSYAAAEAPRPEEALELEGVDAASERWESDSLALGEMPAEDWDALERKLLEGHEEPPRQQAQRSSPPQTSKNAPSAEDEVRMELKAFAAKLAALVAERKASSPANREARSADREARRAVRNVVQGFRGAARSIN